MQAFLLEFTHQSNLGVRNCIRFFLRNLKQWSYPLSKGLTFGQKFVILTTKLSYTVNLQCMLGGSSVEV
jgi:hypothetical protein